MEPDTTPDAIIACVPKKRNLEKARASDAAYRKANREKIADYRKANREKRSAASRAYQKANPERVAAQKAAWQAANREKLKAYNAAYNAANRDRIAAHNKAYNTANRDNIAPFRAAADRNRRARKRAAEGSHNAADIGNIRKLQKDKCGCCRTKLGGKGHIDHIVALSKGGSNWPRNLQLLCASCNTSKRAKDPIDYMQAQGLLL